jgi:hypothetical protein
MNKNRRRTVQSAKPDANRRSAVKRAVARVKPAPIMDQCEECQGVGEVQQHCEDCNGKLTDDNFAADAGGYVCKTCFARENGA